MGFIDGDQGRNPRLVLDTSDLSVRYHALLKLQGVDKDTPEAQNVKKDIMNSQRARAIRHSRVHTEDSIVISGNGCRNVSEYRDVNELQVIR